jgi:hypothetical protein
MKNRRYDYDSGMLELNLNQVPPGTRMENIVNNLWKTAGQLSSDVNDNAHYSRERAVWGINKMKFIQG